MRADLALARKVQAFRARTMPESDSQMPRQWFEFRETAQADEKSNTDLYIYDEISWYGITAMDLVRELMMIETDTITVRLNSPGGNVWDGIAIKNALLTHKASVNVIVDGQAASIASVIMLAGEQITMMPGSRLLIHDASTVCFGTATDMLECAELLEEVNAEIASMYAKRTGKPAAFFREAMSAGTTNMGTRYDADSAVELGLADAVGDESTKTSGPSVVPTAPDGGGGFWDKATKVELVVTGGGGGSHDITQFVTTTFKGAKTASPVCSCGPKGHRVVDQDGQHATDCAARGDLAPRIVDLPSQTGVQWEVVPFDGCCDICQEVIDDGPYEEDNLPDVPVHPNCDCELQVAFGANNKASPQAPSVNPPSGMAISAESFRRLLEEEYA